MKKFAALLALHIYLFSLGGQLAVYQYLNYRANQFFSVQADEGRYKTDDLVEVKIPANLPGIENLLGYESVSGRVQFANAAYNYVKIRLTKHAIYLMCIPNYETTRLAAQNIIHADGIDGIQIPVKDHVPYGKTTIIDGVNVTFTNFEFKLSFNGSIIRPVQPVINFTCHSPDIPERPPQVLS